MRDLNPKQFADEPEGSNKRDPHEIIRDIQTGGDRLMAAVEELIEWTDYDIAQLSDYLKRIGNFLHAVIEAHPKTFAISELTTKLALDERTLRQLLKDVGVPIDVNALNPDETVTDRDLITLLADRAGSPLGERLADLLRGGGPRIVSG